MNWGRSGGRTPRAKEEKARQRLEGTVRGEGRARLHSARGGRLGGLLLGLGTHPRGS